MKNLNVYLSFPGTCEEALNFYKHCFGGEIEFMQRFGESPVETPEHYKQKIMHATFRSEGILIMASDGMPDDSIIHGNLVNLSLNLDDAAEQAAIFAKLSEGGTVTMDLAETFWGASFGMLTDKYGINWMLNRELKASQN